MSSNTTIRTFDLAPRACGDCHACCVVPPISHLDKPGRTRCRHLGTLGCAEGCQVYEERGEVCKGFQCLWLLGALGVGNRPDHPWMGAYFTLHELDPITPFIAATEIIPGALQSELVSCIIRDFLLPSTQLILLQPAIGPTSWIGAEEKTTRANMILRIQELEAAQAKPPEVAP